METCTCSAPVNIAVVKYWGKRDENLVLPINSSVSVTLSQDQLKAKTTVAASKTFDEDRFWLNGREETFCTPRIQNLLCEVRQRASLQNSVNQEMLSWKLHICSENNFPTAAGLASSAAGYACLAYTLAKLYKIEGDISDIARRGSGSACRSVYGGFVVWEKGMEPSGSDSISWQLAPDTHWPELSVLVLVVSDQKKHIGSSEGMQTTVRTSQLIKERVKQVPARVEKIKEAILTKNFEVFAEETMKDSNQLHAVCLDTYPPISYLTDTSRQIMSLVHAYNKYHKQVRVAYTFDAGPNACLYLLQEDVARVISLISHYFPPETEIDDFITGLSSDRISLDKDYLEAMNFPIQRGAIKYILYTKPGPGPQQYFDPTDSLLDETGLPNYLNGAKRKCEFSPDSCDNEKKELETISKKIVKTDGKKTDIKEAF